jgi:hypothetical protein
VEVRASFSLGEEVCAIWDLDLRIVGGGAAVAVAGKREAEGKGKSEGGREEDGVRKDADRDYAILEGSVVGPRTEGADEERRREKELGRGWF